MGAHSAESDNGTFLLRYTSQNYFSRGISGKLSTYRITQETVATVVSIQAEFARDDFEQWNGTNSTL